MYWLMPRLAAFRAREAHLDVWVSTRMTGQAPAAASHDVVILRGPQTISSTRLVRQMPLFVERMTVLTTPALLAREPLSGPGDLTRHNLIASSTRPGDWPRWLAHAHVDLAIPGGGHRFDHLFVAMQAVRDGLGSIVAPQNLFVQHLTRGELVCPFSDLWFEGEPYIAHSLEHASHTHISRFLGWLQEEAMRSDDIPETRRAPRPASRKTTGRRGKSRTK
jgi:DNA-binding transcriptional LysR family regulator